MKFLIFAVVFLVVFLVLYSAWHAIFVKKIVTQPVEQDPDGSKQYELQRMRTMLIEKQTLLTNTEEIISTQAEIDKLDLKIKSLYETSHQGTIHE